jgi:hypothetical protein
MNGYAVTQANILRATGVNIYVPSTKKAIQWLPVVELIVNIAECQPAEFEAGIEEDTREHLALALLSLRSYCPAWGSPVDLEKGKSKKMYELNRNVSFMLRSAFLNTDTGSGRQSWARFAFWTTKQELYVQLRLWAQFLGAPVGGNLRNITQAQLKEGLASMRFRLDEVVAGQNTRGDSNTARWCISAPGFEVDEGNESQPGLDKAIFCVGDEVQWVSQGVLQFPCAQPILRFSADRQYAFFANTSTGIPIGELIRDKTGSVDD